MSLLNLFSISFFLGLMVSLFLGLSVNLWFSLLIFLGLIILIFWRKSNRLAVKALIVISFYLFGLVWPTALSLAKGAIFPDSPFYLPIGKKINEVKGKIENSLTENLNQPESSLAYGVLFGSKTNNFDKSFLNDLRRTGTVHMVAVSGFNMSIIIGILLNTSILVANRGFIVLGLGGLVAYLFLVGFSASVLRSIIMGLYLFTAQVLGRQKNLMDAFLFSGALLLFLNPTFLLDLGYQLSFLSLLGIIYLSPIFAVLFKKLPLDLDKVLGATLAAQIMILPISSFNFGQVSLIAPLANLLTFWTITPIMLLAFLQIIFSPIKILALILASTNSVLLGFFVKVVELLSSLPWAVITF